MDDSEQLRKFESYEGEVLENQGARWENFENTFSARPKSYDEMLYSGVFLRNTIGLG